MNMPFSVQDFLDVFRNYNETVFPLQILFYLIAFTAIYFAFSRKKNSDKIISGILSFFWLWIGIVYHILFFSAINKAAYIFGVLFVVQGLLFLQFGVLKGSLKFGNKSGLQSIIAYILLAYALVIYPFLGYIFGHLYPYSPTFGLPCPTTIFTFGILLLTKQKIPLFLLIIPFLWSLLGFSAAIQLHVYEDFGLLVAGLTATFMIVYMNKYRY